MTQFLNSKRRLIALSYLVRPNMDSKMFKGYEKSNMGQTFCVRDKWIEITRL